MLTDAKVGVYTADTFGNSVTCLATEGTHGYFKHRVLENGTAEITDYTGSVVIPTELNVMSIGSYSLYNCSS